VSYRDHAFGGDVVVEEPVDYVFVCGGALNSTELLIRSRERLLTSETGSSAPAEAARALAALGSPFFANGDALGVVFDANESWQPTEGPTITSSLYVGSARGAGARAGDRSTQPPAAGNPPPPSNGDERESWFLIQDGGMPWSLAPALNLLRSPLWLGRNQLVGRGVEAEQSPLYTPQVRARGDFLAGLPGMLYRNGSSSARSERRSGGADADVSVAGDTSTSLLLDTLPPPARDQAETLLGLKSLVERHLLRMVDKVVARVDGERPGFSFFRWLARLDRDRLGALTKEVLEATYPAARVLLQSSSVWEVLAAGLRSAWRLDGPLENTLVLLAMGADEALELREAKRPQRQRVKRHAHRSREPLYSDPFFREREDRGEREDRELNCRASGRGPQPPLRLEVVTSGNRRARARRQAIYRRQERLMSDIALATGGELRTNPSWTIGRQPITVHAQGGCVMNEVTDVDGKVLGFENLYVMDGAVFPSSVGVNPSHTIAAVAERNIERFIARRNAARRAAPPETGIDPDRPRPLPTDPVPADASKVVEIENSKHDRPAIRTDPAKLVWRERLKGFFVETHAFTPQRTSPARGVIAEHELFALNASVDVFHECERQGALRGQSMELAVTATVRDLDALIDGRSSMVELSDGELGLTSGGQAASFPVAGQLELQLGGTAVSPLARRKMPLRTGGMVYRLADTQQLRLYGFKQLTDDPGLDAWLDLTTLYVDISLPGRALRGVLRVSIPDFLRDQLPSFSIDKKGLAPEQQLWALGQFARFFLGRVGRIYMPEWL
ncbi:MAG TPA: GMC oxidoreductase, partial [Polyangiaceae bacterium]|nr:GMC oxidoreductase [Polyangiaceae bacterium]